MSKYVMSDLHGEYNRFFKMLELIDKLVILWYNLLVNYLENEA